MTTRGFEQFVEKVPVGTPARRENPFADMTLGRSWAKSRAVVLARLRELQNEGRLRLTDILRQPEPYILLALECLTHVYKGTPAQGDSPFADMRFRFRCEAKTERPYKTGIRIVETVDVGGGIRVPGETSEYQVLEPIYVVVPPGGEVELDVVKSIRLLQKYGRDLSSSARQAQNRPWVEVDAPEATASGFDAIKQKRERAA